MTRSSATTGPCRLQFLGPQEADLIDRGTFMGLNGGSGAPEKYDASDAEEWEANARLIVDAFNVKHETGLSPRELVEERDRLRAFASAHDAYMLDAGYSGPDDKALHPKAADNWRQCRSALAQPGSKSEGL